MDEIDRIFERFLQRKFFSGGVCSISIDGQIVFLKAYGKADLVKNSDTEPNTLFDLASITKIFTTTIILQLITRKKISLSTPLKNCLPITSRNTTLANITISQLLTHTSGLKAWHPFYTNLPNDNFFEVLEEIDLIEKNSEEVIYSDLNFMLLGEVIKEQLHEDLETIISQHIGKPLELSSLTYQPSNRFTIAVTEFGNRTEMKMCEERNLRFEGWRSLHYPISGEVNDGNAYYFFSGKSGHAGLFSNIEDLMKLGDLYVKGGAYKGKQLISKELIDQSLNQQVPNRGLGWEVNGIFPEGAGHTGFTGTSIWVVPEKKLTVGILTNRLHVEKPKNINPFRKDIVETVLSNYEKLKGDL
ncbi:serine hydrolase domain-containing protein [Sediminibacillus halophilus]|uniref:CubicO group peptidase, beta-lactamase class C family n=1 Tax=Sediminibacillus halophilus TaxID=482461 RepID=A0A1G9RFY4_9BACI|nr:serine hydrolase [Sediminibacillus halophilus]SDM21970.1 CubicO group peptidase, beta-lactamase class C family [Sediminibacillus halophilus]